jgi:hypothetical protein
MLLEQKNLQGILKNEMFACLQLRPHSIFQIALCHFFFLWYPVGTQWVSSEFFIKIVDFYAM